MSKTPILEFDTKWDLAPAPESTSHIKLKDQYDLFIGGKWVKPESKKYFNTINPATEKVIAKVAEASPKDIDKAVKAARKATRFRQRQLHELTQEAESMLHAALHRQHTATTKLLQAAAVLRGAKLHLKSSQQKKVRSLSRAAFFCAALFCARHFITRKFLRRHSSVMERKCRKWPRLEHKRQPWR